MKQGFIIQQPDSAPRAFFAPGSGERHVPANQTWSEDPAKALCFASHADARTFADVFLPQIAPYVAIIPYTEPHPA